MTLAIVALFADGPTTLRNIGSWRVKETDRITAMATELRKVGADVDEGHDWIRIVPPKQFCEATIDTYDDHRMAMCFSLVAAGGVRVHIRDPGCVAKTFPDYFDRLGGAGSMSDVPVVAIDGPTASGKGTIAQRVADALRVQLPRQRCALSAGGTASAAAKVSASRMQSACLPRPQQ